MPIGLEEFRQRLIDSGVISAEELEKALERVPEGRRPTTAQQLAGWLCKLGRLTVYQVQEIARGHGEKLVLGEYVIQERLGGGIQSLAPDDGAGGGLEGHPAGAGSFAGSGGAFPA
jgi:hypothetical protein